MASKKILFTSLIFLVITCLFNMLCFWLVNDKTNCFYVSVGFGNGSILIYGISVLIISIKNKYVYLTFQNASLAFSYYIVATILNLFFALFELDSIKTDVIINLLILGIYAIVLFYFLGVNSDTVAQLEQDKAERDNFYNIKGKADALLNKGSNRTINKKIESLCDRIHSCQINRTVNVANIEGIIIEKLDELRSECDSNGNEEIIVSKINEIIGLVDQRDECIKDAIRRN